MKLIVRCLLFIVTTKTLGQYFFKNYDQIWNNYVLIHISTTSNLIFMCNTSICRYGQHLYFLYLQRKLLVCLCGCYVQIPEIWRGFNWYFSFFDLQNTFDYKMNSFLLKDYLIATFHILITKMYIITGARYATLFRFSKYNLVNIWGTVTLSIDIRIKHPVA